MYDTIKTEEAGCNQGGVNTAVYLLRLQLSNKDRELVGNFVVQSEIRSIIA